MTLPFKGSRRAAVWWVHPFTPNQGRLCVQLRTQQRDQGEMPVTIPTNKQEFVSLQLPFLPGPAGLTGTGRTAPTPGILGGFVGLTLRSLLQGKGWDCAASPGFPKGGGCPRPQRRLAARPGVGAEPRSPAEPGIPAALGKPGLASAGLTHPGSSQSQEPGSEGSHTRTHGPSVPLAVRAGPLPSRCGAGAGSGSSFLGEMQGCKHPLHAAGMAANGQA